MSGFLECEVCYVTVTLRVAKNSRNRLSPRATFGYIRLANVKVSKKEILEPVSELFFYFSIWFSRCDCYSRFFRLCSATRLMKIFAKMSPFLKLTVNATAEGRILYFFCVIYNLFNYDLLIISYFFHLNFNPLGKFG